VHPVTQAGEQGSENNPTEKRPVRNVTVLRNSSKNPEVRPYVWGKKKSGKTVIQSVRHTREKWGSREKTKCLNPKKNIFQPKMNK